MALRDLPPMANTVMMYEVLGKKPPITRPAAPPAGVSTDCWDRRALGLLPALRVAGVGPPRYLSCPDRSRRQRGIACGHSRGWYWLLPRQVLDLKGDWAVKRPDIRPGPSAGPSITTSPIYPDLDDTASW